MTRRRLIRILIPLAVALVATLVVAKLTAQKTAPTETIVVAAQSVNAGSVLSPQDVQTESVPMSTALHGVLTTTAAAVGEVTQVNLTLGDPILSDEVVPSQAAGISYQIPAGMRAFAVPVNGVSGVAGNLTPGDKVDVLATFPVQSATNAGVASPAHASVVVQDVAVIGLSTGTSSSTTPSAAGNTSPYTLVTLAVTPQQAATISLSEQQGTVTFLLRPHSGAGNGSATVTVGGLP
jgi:pilus assembly protein CpaB